MTSITNNTWVKVPNITFFSTETISKEKYGGHTPNPQGNVDLEKRVGNKAKLLRFKRETVYKL